MNLEKKHLCFVGNMLGQNANYVTAQGEILASLFANEGYKITCVSSKINRIARLADIIKTLLMNKHNIDIVFLDVYSGKSVVIADITGFICKVLKIRLIMILHGGNLQEFIKKHPRWMKRVLDRSDQLVAPSAFLAEKVGLEGYKVQIIPNVVELEDYNYKERSKISPKLIWMRTYHPIYNPEMAVKVLAKLKESEPSATLVMAGADKGLESKIKLMAEKMKLSESIRFAGFLDLKKKLKEFSDSDIYLHTNRIDNMPVSVIEARSMGLPVVATSVGGLPYLIDHGIDGMLVESEDVDAMVKAILKLLNDPSLTQKISQNGREKAKLSSWGVVRQKWENLIEKTLDSGNDISDKTSFQDNL